MASADLVDRGSAPWVVSGDGVAVQSFSKQSKAIAFGTGHALAHPGVLVELSYAGGRWAVSGAPDPDPTPAPQPPPAPPVPTVDFTLDPGASDQGASSEPFPEGG